jgi:DNA primase
MPNEAWKAVYEDFGIPYEQRSGASHALITLCLFTEENTPSLWAYPSGNYICYGCGAEGTIEDFDESMKEHVANLRERAAQQQAKREDWNALSSGEQQQRAQEYLQNLPF